MIRLFVSDIDGTLLNERSELEEETVNAIKRFQAQGGIFMLATGRNPWETEEITSKIDHIVNNCVDGCMVLKEDKEVILSCFLEEEILKKILDLPYRKDCIIHFHEKDATYIMQKKEELYSRAVPYMERHLGKTEAQLMADRFYDHDHVVFSCTEEEILKQKITKAEFIFMEEDLFERTLKDVRELFPHCNITDSTFFRNIEITSEESDKGLAIVKYCRLYNIFEEEVVVAGDGDNDLSMFKRFPNSYAMENGSENAKKAATYIAEANNRKGLARLLNRICDENERERFKDQTISV